MQYRVVWYYTKRDNKYEAEEKFEYLCEKEAAFHVWYKLTVDCNYKHVFIYDLMGNLQEPEKGYNGLNACCF